MGCRVATLRACRYARGCAYWQAVMPQNDNPSDEELMERYRDGDAGAFDALYGRHKGGVFRYLARQCGNRGTAEELFQEVWMNLIRARAAYTVQAKFTTYLYRLAHNRLVDHYRAHAGSAAVSFDDADGPVARHSRGGARR